MRKIVKRTICTITIAIAAIPLTFGQTFANPIIPVPTQPEQPTFTPSLPNLEATGYILMDATSGKILAEKNADSRMPPASLTKLMTMYVVSNALKNEQIHLNDQVRISTKAWKTEGSRMFVKVNTEVPVKELLQGVVVVSGNDAAVALAEYVAGTEETFANLMNQQAKILGMQNSHFTDSTGLPNPEHYSTPHDLALLTQAYIKHFPEDYNLYSEKWFTYNGIRQPNRNRLLWRYQYADGLKTGHTTEAGYCLVGSAKKDGMRLISVVMGEPSDVSRTEDSIRLMTYGFRFFETHKIYKGNVALVQAPVWGGQKANIPLGVTDDFYVTIPTGQYKRMQVNLKLNNPIKAPIVKGQTCGTLEVSINNQVVASTPLIALDANSQGGFFRRAADAVKLKFNHIFSKPKEKINTG